MGLREVGCEVMASNEAHKVNGTRPQRPSDPNRDFRLPCSSKAGGPCFPERTAGPRSRRGSGGSPRPQAQQGSLCTMPARLRDVEGDHPHIRTNIPTGAEHVELTWTCEVKLELANLCFKVTQEFLKTFPPRTTHSFPGSLCAHSQCFQREVWEVLLEERGSPNPGHRSCALKMDRLGFKSWLCLCLTVSLSKARSFPRAPLSSRQSTNNNVFPVGRWQGLNEIVPQKRDSIK